MESLLRLSAHNDPEQGLQGGGADGEREAVRDHGNRVSDGPVLGLVGRVLAEPRCTAHPHIHHHRVSVSRDGTGKRIRLQAPEAIEAVPAAAVRRDHMGAEALRRDALRVL